MAAGTEVGVLYLPISHQSSVVTSPIAGCQHLHRAHYSSTVPFLCESRSFGLWIPLVKRVAAGRAIAATTMASTLSRAHQHADSILRSPQRRPVQVPAFMHSRLVGGPPNGKEETT